MKKLFTFIVAIMAVASMSAQKRVLVWNAEKVDTLNADSITFLSDTYPEWVDLGLPSGTLWADRNIGATTPEGYGDLYQWGAIKTDSVFSINTYRWSRARRKNPYTGRNMSNQWTKYNSIDSLLVLQAVDDIANITLGDSAHIPTYDQMYELLNNCDWDADTINGEIGYRITGDNGNSIFLPTAGVGNYQGRWLDDSGSYWTSSISGYNNRYPYNLMVMPYQTEETRRHYIVGGTGAGSPRETGMSIRAVKPKKK